MSKLSIKLKSVHQHQSNLQHDDYYNHIGCIAHNVNSRQQSVFFNKNVSDLPFTIPTTHILVDIREVNKQSFNYNFGNSN